MAIVYLKPGDRVEAMCELECAGNGEWSLSGIADDAVLRLWREDPSHEDGGQWFQVQADWRGTLSSNPHFGDYFYDDEKPGY